MAGAAREVHVAPSLKAYLVDLAEATRRSPHLALGMSPRATLALQRVAKARAAAAGPRLRHRPTTSRRWPCPCWPTACWSRPRPSSRGISAADALAEVLRAVPVPGGH